MAIVHPAERGDAARASHEPAWIARRCVVRPGASTRECTRVVASSCRRLEVIALVRGAHRGIPGGGAPLPVPLRAVGIRRADAPSTASRVARPKVELRRARGARTGIVLVRPGTHCESGARTRTCAVVGWGARDAVVVEARMGNSALAFAGAARRRVRSGNTRARDRHRPLGRPSRRRPPLAERSRATCREHGRARPTSKPTSVVGNDIASLRRRRRERPNPAPADANRQARSCSGPHETSADTSRRPRRESPDEGTVDGESTLGDVEERRRPETGCSRRGGLARLTASSVRWNGAEDVLHNRTPRWRSARGRNARKIPSAGGRAPRFRRLRRRARARGTTSARCNWRRLSRGRRRRRRTCTEKRRTSGGTGPTRSCRQARSGPRLTRRRAAPASDGATKGLTELSSESSSESSSTRRRLHVVAHRRHRQHVVVVCASSSVTPSLILVVEPALVVVSSSTCARAVLSSSCRRLVRDARSRVARILLCPRPRKSSRDRGLD